MIGNVSDGGKQRYSLTFVGHEDEAATDVVAGPEAGLGTYMPPGNRDATVVMFDGKILNGKTKYGSFVSETSPAEQMLSSCTFGAGGAVLAAIAMVIGSKFLNPQR